MRTFAIVALAATASALKGSFPGFDSFHAHCQITVPSTKSCADIYGSIVDVVDNNKDTASPAGKYVEHEKDENDYVWAVRTTANGKYNDDVIFELAGAANGGCSIKARSRSQSFSVLDNSVNFCNMFNVVKQADNSIADKGCTDASVCKVDNCPHNQSDFTACGRY